MAIYKRDIASINLETGTIHRTFLNHSIGYKDQKADHFGIRVFRDGEPVDLTGVSVQGIFMPPQGDPIAITSGNIVDGNVAEVVLPQACYNYDGQFCLSIKLVDSTNSITGTMRIVDGMVDNTHASGTVAPTGAVPTYQEVLSVYDSMVETLEDYQEVVDTQNGQISDLKSALASTNDGNIPIPQDGAYLSYKFGNYDVGDTISLTPDSSTSKVSIVTFTNLKKGNQFLVTATSGNTALPYAFLTTAGKILEMASGATVTGIMLIAPEDGCLLIVQTSQPANASIISYQNFSSLAESILVQKNNLYGAKYEVLSDVNVSSHWEQGRFSTAAIGGTVGDVAATNRIRTDYIDIQKYDGISFYVTSPYEYQVYYFDKDRKVTAKTADWVKSKVTMQTNGAVFMRLMLKNGDSDILPTANTNIALKESTYPLYDFSKAFDAINNNEPIPIDLTGCWEQGRFTTATPGATVSEIDSANRIRTNYVDISDCYEIVITCASGYSCYYFQFNSSKVVLENSGGWVGGTKRYKVLSTGKYLRLQFKKNDDANITPTVSTNCTVANCSKLLYAVEGSEGKSNDIVYLNNISKMRNLLDNASNVAKGDTSTAVKSRTNLLNLIHFSDIHGARENIARILQFNEYFSDYIFTVLHSGDSVLHDFENDNPFASVGGNTVLNVIGNHDCWHYGSTWPTPYDATETEVYEKFFAPYISNWGVTSAGTNKCYYYKDYANSDIRIIVLDSIHWNEDQKTWFSNLLTSSKTASKAVLIVSHYAAQPGVTGIDCTFDSLTQTLAPVETPAENQMERLPTDAFDAVDSFIEGGGHFIAWLCGHSHEDYIGVVTGHTDQMQIVISCALTSNLYSDCARTPGEKSQDLFNVVSIDSTAKLIKLIRIGASTDKFMRSRETLCINYDTKEVISNT